MTVVFARECFTVDDYKYRNRSIDFAAVGGFLGIEGNSRDKKLDTDRIEDFFYDGKYKSQFLRQVEAGQKAERIKIGVSLDCE